ncbi:aquaporin 2 [Plasmodium gonderi]|uniref:Aquaporin 2 n=1 Tax=Plasmodium gonderi TaxID=77519 RepID=A0A1Y1JUA5_PLAGO|nr:aquaporin 2 [Plasmodium gonderi]GAW83494.1 aquaporin 2 [Plasmodium gonderi]
MKILKGLFRRYVKHIIIKLLKYTKNYVKDITDEVNVKSFKRYKYNFFFEFIGSFIFVFFISIYMLNANQNEEYIIKHTNQINPYKRNDIFIPGDNLFDNEINNVHYVNDNNEQKNVVNILMEQEEKNNDETFKTKNKYMKTDHMVNRSSQNNRRNNLNDLENTEPVEEGTKKNLVKKQEEGNETASEYAIHNEQVSVSSENENEHVIGDNYESGFNEKKESEKTVALNEYDKKEIRQQSDPSKSNVHNKRGVEKDDIVDDSVVVRNIEHVQNQEKKQTSKGADKERLTKNVGTVIFKDYVNEYSKIKVNDINSIDLKDIDKYQVMKNSENKGNSNHAVYSFFGCLIYVLFVLLGAHINPAYTYALWLIEPKKYGFVVTTCYVAFQYFGGILASIICAHMYGSIFIYSLLPKKEIMKTFLCEFISTFLITLLLLSLYNYKKKFMEENKNEDSTIFNASKLRNMTSLYSFNSYEDIYGNDVFNTTYNNRSQNGKVFFHIDNKYIKYIINHIFYLLFIFFSLLFFVFVTNTTLNPMFSTCTLYTYLYFKFFQASGSFNIASVFLSFLSVTNILQLIKLYIQSLPLWIGPYVGSAFATGFVKLFREGDEEIVNIIDTNIYNSSKKNETIPLIGKHNIKQNAYLVEYNDNIHYNSSTYLIPHVF